MNKKIIFALLGVFLMTSGIFVLISYVPTSTSSGNGTVIPALNSVGETAGTSIGVNYWTQSSVANSGTTTVNLPVAENSGYSTVSLGDTSATWSYGDSIPIGYKIEYMNIAIPSAQFWTNSGSDTVELQTIAFMAQYLFGYPSSYEYTVGTIIYANLTLNGAGMSPTTYSWSTTSLASDASSDARVVYIYPQWTIVDYTPPFETYGTANLNITLLAPSGSDYAWVTGGSNVNGYVTSTVESGTTYTTQTSLPAQASVNYEIGYHINSASTSFTIPQYESAFDLTWSSQYDSNPQYNGQSPTGTSGTLTGSLTSNSFTVYPYGSTPNLSGVGDVTFSYNLTSQYQVSTSSTSDTASPGYTYTQVSGTTNQANASFSFSGTTPSTAVFIPYESSQNSLKTDSTSITFTPTITLSNPYSSYAQNELVVPET